MRNSVLYHISADLDSPLKTEDEKRWERLVSLYLTEYRLVMSGVMTYPEFGYHDGSGRATLIVLLRHVVIDDAIKAVEREEHQRSVDKAMRAGRIRKPRAHPRRTR